MSQKYLLRGALSSGLIREAQAKISGEMVRLLHKRHGPRAGYCRGIRSPDRNGFLVSTLWPSLY